MELWSSDAMQSGPELGWEWDFYFPLVHQSSETPPLKEGMTLTKCFSLFEGHSQRGVSWELFVARGWFHPGRGIWWHTCHLLSLLCFLPPADRTGHCSFWNSLPLASELPHSLVFSFFLLLHGSSFFTRISRRCPWTFCPQQKLTISHVFKYYLMSSTFILIKLYFSPVFRIFPDQLFFSSSWMSHKHLKLNIFKVKLIVFSTAPHQRSLSQLLRLKSREWPLTSPSFKNYLVRTNLTNLIHVTFILLFFKFLLLPPNFIWTSALAS